MRRTKTRKLRSDAGAKSQKWRFSALTLSTFIMAIVQFTINYKERPYAICQQSDAHLEHRRTSTRILQTCRVRQGHSAICLAAPLDSVLAPTKAAVLEVVERRKENSVPIEPFLSRAAKQHFYNTSPFDFIRTLEDAPNIRANLEKLCE